MAASYERPRAASSAFATNFSLLPREYRTVRVLLWQYTPGALVAGRRRALREVP
jgi:hypothetical protein